MIEEIKWLIKTLKTITENLNNIADIENITDYEFTYDKIFNRIREIENNLDKYKDQDKYKNAWEELKVIINEDIKTCEEEKVKYPLSKNEWEFAKMTDEEIIKNIENLEQKHEIEVE